MVHADPEVLVPHAVPRSQRLGGVAGVDEQQGRTVLLYEALAPSHAGDQLRVAGQAAGHIAVDVRDLRGFHSQVQFLRHLGADHVDLPPGAGEVVGDLIDASDGRRQADPLELAGQLRQALQRHRQLGPPLVAGQFVDLVDDHPLYAGDVLPQPLAGEQHLKRLRGGDEHVRRVLRLCLPLGLRGISVAVRHVQLECLPELGQPLEHVPVQGAQRSDVQALDPLALLLQKPIEDGQHGRLGLADAGVRHHQYVPALEYSGDRFPLGPGGLVDVLVLQDLPDAGVQQLERH